MQAALMFRVRGIYPARVSFSKAATAGNPDRRNSADRHHQPRVDSAPATKHEHGDAQHDAEALPSQVVGAGVSMFGARGRSRARRCYGARPASRTWTRILFGTIRVNARAQPAQVEQTWIRRRPRISRRDPQPDRSAKSMEAMPATILRSTPVRLGELVIVLVLPGHDLRFGR
jgi:hypothetical protein